MTTDKRVFLHYTTPKGAYVMRALPPDKDLVVRTIRRLRCEAVLKDSTGEIVGCVQWCQDSDHSRKPHWCWWFEGIEFLGSGE